MDNFSPNFTTTLLWVRCTLYITWFCEALGAVLTVVPSNNVIVIGGNKPTETLTLTCRSTPDTKTLFILRIGKLTRDNPNPTDGNTGIAELKATGKEQYIRPVGVWLEGRMTVSGLIRDPLSVNSMLQVALRDLRASDAGLYYCYSASTPYMEASFSINVTAQVLVKSVNMLGLIQQNEIVARDGQMVTLTCETSFTTDTSDITWSYLPPNATPTVRTETSGHLHKTTSTLKFVARRADDGKTFMCETSGGDMKTNSTTLYVVYLDPSQLQQGQQRQQETEELTPFFLGLGLSLGLTIPIIIGLVLHIVTTLRRYRNMSVESSISSFNSLSEDKTVVPDSSPGQAEVM